jgi:hypothetical protein
MITQFVNKMDLSFIVTKNEPTNSPYFKEQLLLGIESGRPVVSLRNPLLAPGTALQNIFLQLFLSGKT